MRDGLASINPRLISCQTRSGTKNCNSPAFTICPTNSKVELAISKWINFAINLAKRRIRSGSSLNASLTCRMTPSLMSRCPPKGSIRGPMISPSVVISCAMAFIVKSLRSKSCSNVTSGEA